MIRCPNCGAEIKEDVTKCPHCGYINIEGAEKKYLDDLEEIKEQLGEVEKEPSKALKEGLSKGIKVILWTVGILAVCIAVYVVMLVIELRNSPKFITGDEEKAYASAYKVTAEEKLEEAFENRDIETMAQIYDKAYSEDRISLWGVSHYETSYAASCYCKLKQCLPNLDKEKISKKEAEEITYYCFYFYYRAYGEDGAVLFDQLRDQEIMPIITERLGYTIEDMENFRDQVTDSSGVFRSKVYSTTKKYYKNYH